MSENLTDKKFIDGAGVGHLWRKIKNRYDSKLDNVRAADDSVTVNNSNQVAVNISSESGNLLELKTTGNKGLYVSNPGSPDSYAIVSDGASGNYSAVYRLVKYAAGSSVGENVGPSINIPRDMVVESGSVVTKDTAGAWGAAGTYIELVLANSNNTHIWVPVGSLIEYVTSGSSVDDAVVITVDPTTHRVSAAITAGAINETMLSSALQTKLAQTDVMVHTVSEGATNGTIDVDGVDVPVHGLGSAAYANTNAFDAAGAAAAVLGTSSDDSTDNTVYGVKEYASIVYESIQPLTTAEIDAAVAAADQG